MEEKTSICDRLVDVIQNKILSGEYKPGDRLPSENDLAEIHGVSRFSVREALKKLNSMGLVIVQQGKGSFINTITPISYMKPLLPLLMVSDHEIEMVLYTRLPIEMQTVSLAAQKAKPQHITLLRELMRQMETALYNDDQETYNRLDLEYHMCIAEASGNPILYEILDVLQDLLTKQIRRTGGSLSKNRSIKRHRMLLDAIENGESTLASEIMRLHITDSILFMSVEEKESNDEITQSENELKQYIG